MQYRVSWRFLSDHIERDLLPDSNVVSVKKGYAVVELDDNQFAELLSDARYYADGGGGLEPEYFGLMSSARAVVRQLRSQR